MSTQTNAPTIGVLQMVTCFTIAHTLRLSATHPLECPVLGSVVCAACHETAKYDSWVRDVARVEAVRKEVLWLGDKV